MNIRIPRMLPSKPLLGETVDFLQEGRCGDLAFFDNEERTHYPCWVFLLNDHTIIHATETNWLCGNRPLDNGGIISKQLRMRTHQLRLIKRLF